MKRASAFVLLAIAVVVAAAVSLLGGSTAVSGNDEHTLARVALGQLKQPVVKTKGKDGTTVSRPLPFVSGAAITAEQQAVCDEQQVQGCEERATGADATPSGDIGLDGTGSGGSTTGAGPAHSLGCGNRDSAGNERVNQDCTYRRQAEEDITYNAADPNNIVAGQNDSRVGFNQCGIDFSTNNGRNWGDMLPPFRQHLNSPELDGPDANNPNKNTINQDPGTFHTYDAASDPTNAVDSQGRAFFSCVAFDVASNASAVFVVESPYGAKGSFYYNIPELGHYFLPDEDNSPLIFNDKEWIAADRYASSPNHDNVYVTWTVFRFGPDCLGGSDVAPAFCESPIFGSMSTDHGHTWSTPQEISGSAPGLCSFGDFFTQNPANANDCNFDQGSSPVVLPNGDLVVAFNNGNTPAGNPNAQQLAVVCHPSGSSPAGTATMNCGQPVKVGDDITAGEPQCDFGRGPEECIPGAYIRTNDYPRITTENTQNGHVYVTWQDYRNGEYDIQLAESTDGGHTWSELGTVNPDRGLDHYFPATDQSPQQGDRIGVSYYRTERVPNENTTPSGGFAPCGQNGVINTGASTTCQPGVGTGNSDYVLAGGTGLSSITGAVAPSQQPTPFDFKVVSPVFPPPDGIQSGFNGDYSGLTINKGTDAHPIWSDTRNVNPYPANGVTHDEDVFTDNVGLPNGHAPTGTGTIGRR
ncbi:MAG TPA: sialidase family protein [Gaiellaceae bacterium]|nr:sialidase family protein [Gaiellaceae bacterium]